MTTENAMRRILVFLATSLLVSGLQAQMKAAAANLEFEKAATLRDRIKQLKSRDLGLAGSRR